MEKNEWVSEASNQLQKLADWKKICTTLPINALFAFEDIAKRERGNNEIRDFKEFSETFQRNFPDELSSILALRYFSFRKSNMEVS